MADERTPGEAGEPAPPLPARVVAAAFLLAALCFLVPLAVIGAGFAGVALIRRGHAGSGAAVLALGAAGTVVGLTVLR